MPEEQRKAKEAELERLIEQRKVEILDKKADELQRKYKMVKFFGTFFPISLGLFLFKICLHKFLFSFLCYLFDHNMIYFGFIKFIY
jgi:hypothetical protein